MAEVVFEVGDSARLCGATAPISLVNGSTVHAMPRNCEAAFSKKINLARRSFLEDPLGAPLIPNWNRVIAARPDFFSMLNTAVESDNTGLMPARIGLFFGSGWHSFGTKIIIRLLWWSLC